MTQVAANVQGGTIMARVQPPPASAILELIRHMAHDIARSRGTYEARLLWAPASVADPDDAKRVSEAAALLLIEEWISSVRAIFVTTAQVEREDRLAWCAHALTRTQQRLGPSAVESLVVESDQGLAMSFFLSFAGSNGSHAVAWRRPEAPFSVWPDGIASINEQFDYRLSAGAQPLRFLPTPSRPVAMRAVRVM